MKTTPEEAGRRPARDDEEPPPFGGSWRALYALVLGWLALQVALFHLFTRLFR